MDTSILTRIQSDVQNNQVMLYMKGTPVFPQCGFSATVVGILAHEASVKGEEVAIDPGLFDV